MKKILTLLSIPGIFLWGIWLLFQHFVVRNAEVQGFILSFITGENDIDEISEEMLSKPSWFIHLEVLVSILVILVWIMYNKFLVGVL